MDLLRSIEGIRTPFFDSFFGIITRLGEQTILIVIFCLLFWCINKRMAYIMGFVFFMSSLAVQGLKIIFRVPRPWVYDPTFVPVNEALVEATGYAFPSGHTQNAAAYLGVMGALFKHKALKIIFFTLPVLVAFSRMYLGVHYLSDVVVSLVITFVIIFFAIKIFTDEPVDKKRELLLALFIIAVSIIVIIVVAVLYHRDITTPSQLRDASRAAAAAIAFAIGMYVEKVYINFSVKTRNILWQIIKYVIGLGITLGVMEGARILGSGLIADGFRYFLVVIWIMLVYPLIIKRFFEIK